VPGMADLLREAQKNRKKPHIQLLVVPWHTKWLEMTEEERYEATTEDAAQFAKDVLLGKFKRPRDKRFSASSLGGCERALLFGFAGVPKIGEDPDAQDLMSMGSHDHLFWQVEGLSLGWLKSAERFVLNPRTRVGGSTDGINYDDSIFELKTVTSAKFSKVRDANEPFIEHLLQADFYGDVWGSDLISVVYQDRQYGTYHEFRVERTNRVNDLRVDLEHRLGNYLADDTLPPMLADCEMRTGPTYRQCPYRNHCPSATRVTREER
jgi:hypothetical protein